MLWVQLTMALASVLAKEINEAMAPAIRSALPGIPLALQPSTHLLLLLPGQVQGYLPSSLRG